MTKPAVFALGAAFGAWTLPLAQLAAARITGRHYLANTIKEKP